MTFLAKHLQLLEHLALNFTGEALLWESIGTEFLQSGNLLDRSYQSTIVRMACCHTGSNWMNENFYLLHKYYGSTHFLCVQSGIKHNTSTLFAMYRSEKCLARKVSGLVLCFASMRPLPLLYMLIDGHTCSQYVTTSSFFLPWDKGLCAVQSLSHVISIVPRGSITYRRRTVRVVHI